MQVSLSGFPADSAVSNENTKAIPSYTKVSVVSGDITITLVELVTVIY